jgi:hypothetical protein
MTTFTFRAIAASLCLAATACARGERSDGSAHSGSAPDSAFAGVQERGQAAMGVDQYTSAHVFEDLPDGGRVVLDRAGPDDPAGVATIRAHMRDIAAAFARGDFTIPGFVHARGVPGTAVMAAKRGAITYTPADRPRGGELRIASRDPEAVRAIHEFLAFQRADHRAAGHEGGGAEHAGHGASPPSNPPGP